MPRHHDHRHHHHYLLFLLVLSVSPSQPSDSGPGSEGGKSGSSMKAVVEVACLSPRQVMNGFGGSFTDSATITMNSLSSPVRDALLRSYFSSEGLEYDLVRVPIGGSDFSTRPYTYNDDHEGDVELRHFQLAEEDLVHKLPLIRRALGLARRPLKILASPWSAPAWMKTNGKINETGELLKEMRGAWANYLVRFVKEYEKAGVPIWGMTSANHGFTYEKTSWNSMSWNPSDMRDWIKENLGPTIHSAGLERVKLYIGDDTRHNVDNFYRQILHDPEAARYVSGLAFHWYSDKSVGPDVLDHAHLLFPEQDVLYTEACIESGGVASHQPVVLGSWGRAERYAQNIIEDVNHFASGWIDWNLALDSTGGPNWAGNTVDAPVIINTEKDEFYKQPMFYVLGHFSKFVPAGSVSIPSWVRKDTAGLLHTAAFIHPDGHIVLQLLNKDDREMEVRVEWEGGDFTHAVVPARSLQTLLLPWDGDANHAKRKYFL
ncbi:lysosomal acid glucosylceramidase-like isoform X2 [Portunus trituberculatus]|uniref:lysosomal acid glucosylceramidase-like isoform X2 n=1 Tax=Portunus trituberculatus TaxID=210409 RepID=UPI001E1D0F36|nr:lysosomal acid glucosylceramidase-like isoform X2 [Portunus trituberculatus]